MGKPILKDGKFWRDGVEVPPRIGDAEQIALVKQVERDAEWREIDANGDGIELEFELKELWYTGKITCICGHVAGRDFVCRHFGDKDWIEGIVLDDCDEDVIKCPHCRRDYKIVSGRAVLIAENI